MTELLDDLIDKLESIRDAVDFCRRAPWFSLATWKGVSRYELREMINTVTAEVTHALIEANDLRLLADLAPPEICPCPAKPGELGEDDA